MNRSIPLSLSHLSLVALLSMLGSVNSNAQESETPPADVAKMTQAKRDEIPHHLRDKFLDLAKAVESSAKVFDKLSTDQMNHRPANGSHTPRWNVEHNRGVQWLFFSKVFHEFDQSVKIVSEMPKQQPKDYVAKHPEWTGKQEADHTRKMMLYCVENAALLSDLSLDDKAPNNRWPSLGAFMDKMIAHHGEHTANVVEKTKASDWPSE